MIGIGVKEDVHLMSWRPFVEKEIVKLQPDLIIDDFVTMVGTFIADDLKIPVIINNPGSFELYDFTGTFLPASKNMNQCCRCICLRRKA